MEEEEEEDKLCLMDIVASVMVHQALLRLVCFFEVAGISS